MWKYCVLYNERQFKVVYIILTMSSYVLIFLLY